MNYSSLARMRQSGNMETEASIAINPVWNRLFIASRKNFTLVLFSILLCSLIYYLLGLLSFHYSSQVHGVPAIWLPSGLALFMVLLGGYRFVLVPLLGMTLLVIQQQYPLPLALGAVAGATLESFLPVLLLRMLGFEPRLERIRDVMLFVAFGTVLGPLLAASAGVLGLSFYAPPDLLSWSDSWLAWWLAGSVGCLVLAGLLLVWATSISDGVTARCRLFLFSLLSGVALASMLSLFDAAAGRLSLIQFAVVPLVVIAATYCGRQGSVLLGAGALAALLVTMQYVSPGAQGLSGHSLMTLNLALIWVASFTGLVVASAYSERGAGALYAYQAKHDGLTRLINRPTFERRLERAIVSARQAGRSQVHALMFIDLDDFKRVNDQFGHATGDLVLRKLAELLESQVRNRDTVARLGGDEFVVLLENCSRDSSRQMAVRIGSKVRGLLIPVGTANCQVTASIGVVPIGADTGGLDSILSAADEAHYRAKSGGKNQVHYGYSEGVSEEC
ncbi:MAG: sensor domain-containing diguanylate cyclase [Sedimenticola thiotaurini]|uniref:Sensor domain-containing diguanylate cyclase n=1 Tax=Sedimenticola thiotaurini TaxID=1543721 RepID=A0A558DFQ6_9GAMM|nr:MAG: sensor domain-containing diguanylate cyclase [Sedimenticola thiotaurini]